MLVKEELEKPTWLDTKGEGFGPMSSQTWEFVEHNWNCAEGLFWDANLEKAQNPIVTFHFHGDGTEFWETNNSTDLPPGKCLLWGGEGDTSPSDP